MIILDRTRSAQTSGAEALHGNRIFPGISLPREAPSEQASSSVYRKRMGS
jgi:hypothetical protein